MGHFFSQNQKFHPKNAQNFGKNPKNRAGSSSESDSDFLYNYQKNEENSKILIQQENVAKFDEVKKVMILGAKNTNRDFFEEKKGENSQKTQN